VIGGSVSAHGACASLVGDYNLGSMPRVGEFCASNITRLLLGVVIVLVLVAALGEWLFHSPGRGTPIQRPASTTEPLK
jgi:hypothetical protein